MTDVVTSPSEESERGELLVSTTGAVLLAGGTIYPSGLPDPAVKLLDRASNTWRDLPPLPGTTFLVTGFAVADVPYFVGQHCPDLPDEDFIELDEMCEGAVVHASSTRAPAGRRSRHLRGSSPGTTSSVPQAGQIVASNSFDGSHALAVVRRGPTLVQTRIGPVDLGRLPDGGPARAGLIDDGNVLTSDLDGAMTTTPIPIVKRTLRYQYSSEVDGILDLLIVSPQDPEPRRRRIWVEGISRE